ncbi:GNAT family N-acetyltransferase [Polaribacter sp. HL-MS24]|uniref:GNAT family N-acetyltransferase n=1 Tax=Polaribacter sp. HL-MS24 TaxID=3077735 RepID=UPI002934EE5A|nr:GNAT family N-acetyltransferase [Polaribacter sp. HL-MS24]WOC40980.1 GNAT family N-acetyltransferase [Polaribacter sp. HL-MS24]
MIQYQLTTTAKELEQILALQQQNLSKNLSTQEKKEQGFVTLEHSFQELKKFHDIYPHIIAKDNNILVGYALSMDISCKGDIELLRPMFDEIDAIYYDPYIVMGQICIDHNYRGKGVFKGLYALMQKTFASKYTAIITEIDASNSRSMNAHQKVGFTELTRYFSNNQEWVIVILESAKKIC